MKGVDLKEKFATFPWVKQQFIASCLIWFNSNPFSETKSGWPTKLISSSDSESKMFPPSLPLWLLCLWLYCEKYSLHAYCSSRETLYVILGYKIIFFPLIGALLLQTRNLIVLIFLSTHCHWQKWSHSRGEQICLDSAWGQVIIQCHSRSLCPKIELCFRSFRKDEDWVDVRRQMYHWCMCCRFMQRGM